MFSGSIVALITPFENGHVDHRAIRALVKWHARAGTSAIVVCGSTGESALLTHEEQGDIIFTAVEAAEGMLPIIAGCGAPGTAETVALAQQAQKAGADGLMIVAPYYVKPSQLQIMGHFKAVHDATDLPIIIYNNAGRACVEITIDTIVALANELPRAVALKDASADITRCTWLRMRVPNEFTLLSGDDPTVAGFLAHGGDGMISVNANVVPEMCAQFVLAWHQKHFSAFNALRDKLLHLSKVLFCEPSPSATKYALSLLDKCNTGLRAPLTELSEESKNKVYNTLIEIGALEKQHA